ncbi:MAG: glycosyltransferase family 4 protein, partial [Rhodospirillales bacterium]|nr:glycosyltransferase family 4 protein [Rhodospirillales bacterium]
ELFLYRRSDAIAALTGSFKENLVDRGIDGGKIAIVINGVDLARYSPRPRDEALAGTWGLEGKFVAGYIGTHGMAHALTNVLDAAERLKDRDHIRFLLVGAGAERDTLIADAKKRGLSNVIFMPRQPKEQMPAVWSLCDVALVHLKDSPVFAGVIPSKIFEAEAMGLPLLLAAPLGEASTIVLGDKAGLHVAAEDPDALAEAVSQLSVDKSAREQYAAASLAAAPNHSRETQALEMLDVLQMAAAGDGDKVGRETLP